jgi:hypothetical protein
MRGGTRLWASVEYPLHVSEQLHSERLFVAFDYRDFPPRKDRPVSFNLPPIKTAADALTATGALVAAVAAGDLTPSEAAELSKLIEAYVKSLEVTDLAARIASLERTIANESPPK